MNLAIIKTIRDALLGHVYRNLVMYHVHNGIPLPEDSETWLQKVLAGYSLTVEFVKDGFLTDLAIPSDPDEASEPAAEV